MKVAKPEVKEMLVSLALTGKQIGLLYKACQYSRHDLRLTAEERHGLGDLWVYLGERYDLALWGSGKTGGEHGKA